MNYLRFILILLFVTTVAFAKKDESHNETDEIRGPTKKTNIHEINLNDAFDKSLSNIRTYIYRSGMDPMDISDTEITMPYWYGWITFKIILHHGYIQQLSTIVRTDDIIMRYDGDKVSFYLNIGWDVLDLSHEYSLRYLSYVRKGNCYGRYENVKAKMLVEYDFKIRKINLKFIEFTDVGKFNIRLEGHWIDGFFNVIVEMLTTFFRENVLQMIEAKTYEEIYKQVQEINDMIPEPMTKSEIMKKLLDNHLEFNHTEPYKVDIQNWM